MKVEGVQGLDPAYALPSTLATFMYIAAFYRGPGPVLFKQSKMEMKWLERKRSKYLLLTYFATSIQTWLQSRFFGLLKYIKYYKSILPNY